MPQRSLWSARRLLGELRRERSVARRWWARPSGDGRPPIRQSLLWSLTRRGLEMLKEHDQYPPKILEPRSRRMVPHDAMTSEIITRIIERGRAVGLSGVYIEREVRLDPERARPVMDALIIVRVGGDFPYHNLVPWTKDPRIAGERSGRLALENDRDSEPIATIIGKA
jgi:hypothetical protein